MPRHKKFETPPSSIRCRLCRNEKDNCRFISFKENLDVNELECLHECSSCRNHKTISGLLTRYGAEGDEDIEDAIQIAVYFKMDRKMSAFYKTFRHLVATGDMAAIWQEIHNDYRLAEAAVYFQNNATMMGVLLPGTPPATASSPGFLQQYQDQGDRGALTGEEENRAVDRQRVLNSPEEYHRSTELLTGDLTTFSLNLNNLARHHRDMGTFHIVEPYVICATESLKSAYRHASRAVRSALGS